MASDSMHKTRNLYANLMGEAKFRLACIELAIGGKTQLPAPAVREFCYLQLRLLCELISLGCLVAHGDISSSYSKRLMRNIRLTQLSRN